VRAFLCAPLLVFVPALFGQNISQITLHGVVGDRSGAAVEHAKVQIKNVANGSVAVGRNRPQRILYVRGPMHGAIRDQR
jgi:hypothetical protein